MRNDQFGKPLVLVCFDKADAEPSLLRHAQHFAQQDGLADTAQADRYEALGGSAELGATEADSGLFQQFLPAAEFGRRRTGTWSVWVLEWVHWLRTKQKLSYVT